MTHWEQWFVFEEAVEVAEHSQTRLSPLRPCELPWSIPPEITTCQVKGMSRRLSTEWLRSASCRSRHGWTGLGHTTSVCDCLGPLAPGGLERNTDWVLETKPDLVGFSTTTSAFLDACDMAQQIKARRPEVKIIVGGAHPSAIGQLLLEHFPDIDYLCLGEGEETMADLAEGKALQDIGNLVYRDNGKVIANPRRPRLEKLDDLPFPAYEKLAGFPEAYHLPLFSFAKRYGATMITSRGCTFTCSYCDRTVFQSRYTSNSPQYIWEHMRHLRDHFDVHHINFYDDLFTASRRRVSEICELLARQPLGMDFNCAVRVGHADQEMLRSAKAGRLPPG